MCLNFNHISELIDFLRTERIREVSRLSNDRSDWLRDIWSIVNKLLHEIKRAKSSVQRNENLTRDYLLHICDIDRRRCSLQAGSRAAVARAKVRRPETSQQADSASENKRPFRRFPSLADFSFVWSAAAHGLFTGGAPSISSAKSGKQLTCAVLHKKLP